MVIIRKGYTLFARRGSFAFLRWALLLPFAGPGSLAESDPDFPNIWDYMPEHLERAYEPPPASAPSSELAHQLPQRAYDIVVLPIFDFEFRFQRPQQIAAQFARLGHRVFWISPGRFLPPASPDSYKAIPLRDNIWEVQLRGERPDIYGGRMATTYGNENLLSGLVPAELYSQVTRSSVYLLNDFGESNRLDFEVEGRTNQADA